MRYIADLHVHSHYAYATSKYLNLETLYQWSKIKGIDVVGTGDFTHPAWQSELKEKLTPLSNGLFQLKNPPTTMPLDGVSPKPREVYFCLSTEVSCIYKDQGTIKKSHHLIYAPSFEAVAQLSKRLAPFGNLQADGRPTLKLSARNLLEIVLESHPQCYLIPAHIWTPWFSIFGAKSGYDDIQDCFQDLTDHIFALETGLSSDPPMNRKVSALDRYTLVSNSDAHSPQNLGREANCFDTTLSYEGIFKALQTRKGFLGTLEFFPEEGKYFHDGHRNCALSCAPEETRSYGGICPLCKRPLTLGVSHRVEALGDRRKAPSSSHVEPTPTFRYIVPLPEIIAQVLGRGVQTKSVRTLYRRMIQSFGDEFSLLCEVPLERLRAQLPAPYPHVIEKMRTHQVTRTPGYDGRYGTIHLWERSPLTPNI